MFFGAATCLDTNYCNDLYCFNFRIRGFLKCQTCLPNEEVLLRKSFEWNCDYNKNHIWTKNQHKYRNFIATNCVLTSKMLQEKFEVNLQKVDTIQHLDDIFTASFCQIHLVGKRRIIHILTIIGNCVVHSFHGRYLLKITLIDDTWKRNFELNKWSVICECEEFRLSRVVQIHYYFPNFSFKF